MLYIYTLYILYVIYVYVLLLLLHIESQYPLINWFTLPGAGRGAGPWGGTWRRHYRIKWPNFDILYKAYATQ